MTSAASLLELYDLQLRGSAMLQADPGLTVESEGPVVRASSTAGLPGMVSATGIRGLAPRDWDELIQSQLRHFRERGQPFEWKTFSHDHPQGFLQRLEFLGFCRGEAEAVMIAASEPVSRGGTELPPGVEVFALTTTGDFDALAAQLEQSFGEDHAGRARGYEQAVRTSPQSVFALGARAAGALVASGRLELVVHSDFGTLWGGSVVPAWRHRGLYRALVQRRAQVAVEGDFSWLEVDALPSSRPILERMGFVTVTTTVPYSWSPGPR